MTSSNAEGQRHSAAMTEGRGRNPREQVRGADVVAGRMGLSWPKAMDVMEAVVERENMRAAAKRVRSNKGVRSGPGNLHKPLGGNSASPDTFKRN